MILWDHRDVLKGGLLFWGPGVEFWTSCSWGGVFFFGRFQNTFQNTVGKQFKILKGQRQIEEKRFKGVHHLHKSIEAELTKLERNRSEQEATFRAELEKETLKFKKKFLQDTRKQKEDQLKMMLNILQIPWTFLCHFGSW